MIPQASNITMLHDYDTVHNSDAVSIPAWSPNVLTLHADVDVLVVRVHCEHENADTRRQRPDLAGRLDAGHRGHGNVLHDHIGLERHREIDSLTSAGPEAGHCIDSPYLSDRVTIKRSMLRYPLCPTAGAVIEPLQGLAPCIRLGLPLPIG
jgi:hypothetical protein